MKDRSTTYIPYHTHLRAGAVARGQLALQVSTSCLLQLLLHHVLVLLHLVPAAESLHSQRADDSEQNFTSDAGSADRCILVQRAKSTQGQT